MTISLPTSTYCKQISSIALKRSVQGGRFAFLASRFNVFSSLPLTTSLLPLNLIISISFLWLSLLSILDYLVCNLHTDNKKVSKFYKHLVNVEVYIHDHSLNGHKCIFPSYKFLTLAKISIMSKFVNFPGSI